MAVAVHDDDAGCDWLELADEPAAVDERGADPYRERHDRHRIFDEVVMQRDDPSRLWIFADRRSETAALFEGYQSKCVGEGEMRLRVRIKDGDAEPVLGVRRQNHRELIVEDAFESEGAAQAAIVREVHNPWPMRRQRLIERLSESPGVAGDDAHAIALRSCNRRKRPHLPQPLADTERKIEPSRIGAVDDVQVVIAGKQDHACDETRVLLDRVEKFGPFRREAGIGHVAADEHEVERFGGMDGRDARHNSREAIVATWASATAFDTKTISFADLMNV